MVMICDGCQAEEGNRHSLISRGCLTFEAIQNEVNDIRSERLARSANPLALLAAAQPYSNNYYQVPKPQRSNTPSYMQSSVHRAKCTPDKRQRDRQPHYFPILVPFLRKTVIQNNSEGNDMQKELGHSLLSISRSCTNPTTTTSTSSHSRNRLKIPHQGITTTISQGSLGSKDDDSSGGLGNSRQSGSATKWDTML
ncbi:hypothetical protein Tco_0110600 [Tanacetum coccineum]